ncbi:MAG TPA: tRNA glutamyl-Q(34) synthetase GluQRS [Rhodanobacteraceae bacterium]|nr:tRNA glutamyl-Q(34) synthetase GluQRS [Rhodanobacteraceae bacterium]
MHYRGRFAPSPTGELHFGSLVAALASWLCARHAGGRWLLRVEDIDAPREVPGSATAIISSLQRLGLRPDAPPLYQSTRGDTYLIALDRLRDGGHAFPCWCSRTELLAAGGMHRDGRCIAVPDPARPPAWRLRVAPGEIAFDDELQGPQLQDVREAVGDFVLRRSDGLWCYQLACVVDDGKQRITDVVRGHDLLDSTPRQILLQRLLGLPTPRYLHLPLAVDETGRKLSKSDADRPLDAVPAPDLLRRALAFLGLPGRTLRGDNAPALLDSACAAFDPSVLPRGAQLAVSLD